MIWTLPTSTSGVINARIRELGEAATIVAHEGVLTAMSTPGAKTPAAPEGAWPG